MKKNRLSILLFSAVIFAVIIYSAYGMVNQGKEEDYISVSVIVNDSSSERWDAFREGLEQGAEEEMQTLIQVYNSMIHRIQVQIRTIQENASAQEKLKDQELENLKIRNMLKTSELKALQMQINPHFLYNALDTVNWMAMKKEIPRSVIWSVQSVI